MILHRARRAAALALALAWPLAVEAQTSVPSNAPAQNYNGNVPVTAHSLVYPDPTDGHAHVARPGDPFPMACVSGCVAGTGTASNAQATNSPSSANGQANAWNFGFNVNVGGWRPFVLDTSDNLKVNCASGCAGGTASNASDAQASSSTNGQTDVWNFGWNGTGWDRLQVDGSKNLKINCAAGCAGGTFSNSGAAVAPSSTNGQSGVFNYAFDGANWQYVGVVNHGFLTSDLNWGTPGAGYVQPSGGAGAQGWLSDIDAQLKSTAPVPIIGGTTTGNGTITALDSGTTTTAGQGGVGLITGSPTANASQTIALSGLSAVTVVAQTSTAFPSGGAFQIETSGDGGVTYEAASAKILGSAAVTSSITGYGSFRVDVTGMDHLRVRSTAYTSGTLTLSFAGSAASGLTQIINPIRLTDGTNTATITSGGAQVVSPAAQAVGTAAFAGSTVSVTGTSGSPTLLAAARAGAPGTGRVQVTIVNNTASPAVLTICSTSNCTTGFPLIAVAGANITLNTTSAVYGFSTATQTVGVLETY